jgi:hypothetical protein
MKKIQLNDVKSYEAPGHFGMTAMRLHGKEETGASRAAGPSLLLRRVRRFTMYLKVKSPSKHRKKRSSSDPMI